MQLFDWWVSRYVYVHQRVLEEPSQSLNTLFVDIVAKIDKLRECLKKNELLESLLLLETGYVHLLYGEVQKTKQLFEKAYETVGITIEWTGLLIETSDEYIFSHYRLNLTNLTLGDSDGGL